MINNKIEPRTKEQAIFVGKLVLSGNSKKSIAETMGLNETSVERMINVVLPQVDNTLYGEVSKHIEKQRTKTMVENLRKDMNAVNNVLAKKETVQENEKVVEPAMKTPQSVVKKPRRSVEENNELAINIADYIIENNCTMSEANKKFGIAPNNMHYVNNILPKADPKKFKQVRAIVDGKKKQTTPSNVTTNGLEKAVYEFKKGGDPMYNSVAICKYVLDNNAYITEVSEYFGVGKEMVMTLIDYMEKLDRKKHEKVIKTVLRGKYTGEENYIKTTGKLPYEIKEHNATIVCDYIIANNATMEEAYRFFGVHRTAVTKSINNMIDIDYDKYYKTKMCQKTLPGANHVVIRPNPKDMPPTPVEETTEELVEEPAVLVVDNTDVTDNGMEYLVDEDVVDYEDDLQEPEEPKMTFWQRVKFVFGFGV